MVSIYTCDEYTVAKCYVVHEHGTAYIRKGLRTITLGNELGYEDFKWQINEWTHRYSPHEGTMARAIQSLYKALFDTNEVY